MRSKEKLISKSLVSHGRNIAYQLGGNQDADEYILFVNGMFSNNADWVKQKRAFENHYKVVFFNYRNVVDIEDFHQASAFFDVITDDIKAILDKEDIKKIMIVSHSMGGTIGLYFVIRFPAFVHKIVMINSGVEVGLRFKIIISAIIKAVEDNVAVSFLFPFAMAWWYSNDYLERITQNQNQIPSFDLRKASMTKEERDVLIRFLYCVFEIPKQIPRIDSIQCPVLLISADNDVVFPVEIQKKHLNKLQYLRLEVIDVFSHNIHMECFQQVNKIIMSFFQE